MSVPEGYKRSRHYWFLCPACAHRSFISYIAVKVQAKKGFSILFWCASCGRVSSLKRPSLPAVLALCVLGPIAFVVIYSLLMGWFGGMSILQIVVWSAIVLLTQHVLFLVAGRFAYQYVLAREP
jgi:hypothetical protein